MRGHRRRASKATGAGRVLAAAVLLLGLAGCAPAASSNTGETLTVFAAASLKASFTELAAKYEEQHPGTRVRLSFAGSSDLATQITQGAPADVFASADTATMERVTQAGMADGGARVFAANTLALAVPPGNPAGIRTFADLARPGTRLVACAPQVPCGAAAAAVARRTGTDLQPVSEENSVTDVLGKVISGEADAGLVYQTDVRAADGKVDSVPFPEAADAPAAYPIVTLAGAADMAAAAAFVELVAGPEGQRVLEEAGFRAGGEAGGS
ncbi:molybdate ABC transporter substrate-binding protein [Pseudarthrobacter sp. NPDC058362]|uniref:molybdate ABC transporter substrate-binding protein n=1 Tax=unclassified Pseudarthrobacter TaxID=2647000 RepID=UPI003653E4DF